MLTIRNLIGIVALSYLAALSGCGGGGDSGGGLPPPSTTSPAITSQPADATALEGNTAQFGVTAIGTAPLTYQWQRNGAPIVGATSATYVTPVLTLADSGAQYSVVVTNTAGAAASNRAALTVNPGMSELSLLAGTATGSGYLDGARDGARFASPYALAFDTSGNAYVSDGGNAVIRKIDTAGIMSTLAGLAGLRGLVDGASANARFSFPRGLTLDVGGVIYVADYDAHAVRRITPAGVVTTLAGSGSPGASDNIGAAASFNAPSGVAIDGTDLLVTDSLNHTIRRITQAGAVTTEAGQAAQSGSADGPGATARFAAPWAIAAAGPGRFIILERATSRLRLLQGGMVTTLATLPVGTTMAEGLAVDAAGNAYVTSAGAHVVYRWDQASGVITVVAGTVGTPGAVNGPVAQALFTRPRGLAFRSASELVVADTGNRSLRSLSLAMQAVTTFAGSQRTPGFVNGVGTAARFGAPYTLRANSAGNLMLIDFDNRALREVSPAGDVSTFYVANDFIDGIAPESSGSVLIGRGSLSIIERISPTGTASVFAGIPNQPGANDGPLATAQFAQPRAIARDAVGGFYVGDDNGTIRYISPAGSVSTSAGVANQQFVVDGPRATARVQSPFEVAVDSLGNVYFLDGATHAVRKLDVAGNVSLFAGSYSQAGHTDGPALSARFNGPVALAIDGSNNIYIADTFNHAIRKISPAGVVSTVVGSAGVGTFQFGSLPGRIAFPSGITIVGRTLYISHEDGVSRVTYVP